MIELTDREIMVIVACLRSVADESLKRSDQVELERLADKMERGRPARPARGIEQGSPAR